MANHPASVTVSEARRLTRPRPKSHRGTSPATSRATTNTPAGTDRASDIQSTSTTTTPIQSRQTRASSSINKAVTHTTEEEEEEEEGVEGNDDDEQTEEGNQAEEDNNSTAVLTSPVSEPQQTRRYPSRNRSLGPQKVFSAVNATPKKRAPPARITTPAIPEEEASEDDEDRMDTEEESPARSSIKAREDAISDGSSDRYLTPSSTSSSSGSASNKSTSTKKSTPRKKQKPTIKRIIAHRLCNENLGASYNTFDLLVEWHNKPVPEWWTEDYLWDEHKAAILKYWGKDSELRRRALTTIPTAKRRNGWLSRIDARLPIPENEDQSDMSVKAWVYVLEWVGYPEDVTEELTYDELVRRAPQLIKNYAKENGLRLPGK